MTFLIFLLLLSIVPFYLVVVNATHSSFDIVTKLNLLPGKNTLENYTTMQSHVNIWRGFLNSLCVAVPFTFFTGYFGALTAFGFAKYHFKGKKTLFAIVLASMMLPSQLSIIGFYQLNLKLNMLNTYTSLILPGIANASAVFFLRGIIEQSIPLSMMEAARLEAYADYFVRFVKEYQHEGITIDQIHVQNEPVANQKFPSCMWTGAELKEFIRDYLGPTFKKNGLDTEIWLGTINAPGCDYNRLIFDKWATEDYDYFANTVLEDDEARQYITGVSYQWGGKIAIQRTFESWWPELRLMQSENECGFGDNTWEYATYVWTMLKHYIGNGAESYMYWNLILAPWGVSTWGDPQNAMVTVQNGDYTFNPDFYVMKHFSNAVQRGAVRLGAAGHWAADALIFRNPDGSYAVEAFNPFREEKCLTVELEGEVTSFMLAPRSFNSMIITV